ncbi:MAG: hypothetical protein WEA56_10400 [Balneolaceae bacterium]
MANQTGGLTVISILLLSWLITTGCNETFEPWQENDQYYFSIYGYLDASADTQWVRVMPVREDLLLEPGPIDASVTLTHMESGNTVAMNDSLYEFAHNTYAYNFWATTNLQPGQTYRITAERRDGKSSHAEVVLPPDFPTPTVFRRPQSPGGGPPLDIITIEGVERFADIRTIHYIHFANSGQSYRIPFIHIQDTLRRASGELTIEINPREDTGKLGAFLGGAPWSVFHQQIFIASAGPGFHYFPSIDEKMVALPEGISNVVNGVGYLAGLVSKTIPYESCFENGIDIPVPCETEPYVWSETIPLWGIE